MNLKGYEKKKKKDKNLLEDLTIHYSIISQLHGQSDGITRQVDFCPARNSYVSLNTLTFTSSQR